MGKVTIDGKESQESYGLVLAEAVIGQPELETVIISVPGRSGALDCTEKLSRRRSNHPHIYRQQ